ncbi:MAG TPA: hypothetical protein VF244_02930 [Acidimicrobiales bacterium]
MSSERPGITRRRFLAYTAASGTIVLVPDSFALQAAAQLGQDLPLGAAQLVKVARRREDFLSLVLEFHNLKLNNTKPRRLVKINSNQAAFLVVGFPPQHLSDQSKLASELVTPDGTNTPGEIQSRLAQRTRLVFVVGPEVLPMPFNLDALLNWAKLQQRVVAAAGTGAPPANLTSPPDDQTAIELPWRLVLSPRPDAGWAHARLPVEHKGRTEMWHTRLGTRVPPDKVDEHDPSKRKVRAVWARDPGFSPATAPNPPDQPPFFSLSADDRWQIVGLSARVANRRAIDVDRLMLSTLGGWLDVHGAWEPTGPYSLEDWRHRATMGRDSYVRTVKRGFLMPFGHKAAFIDIDERQFRKVEGHPEAAYLVKRQFIVVREPLKRFGQEQARYQPQDGRGFPFRSVRITTLVTPDLFPPANEKRFVPVAEDQTDVLFDCIGLDWDGQSTEFKTRLAFVDQGLVFGDEETEPVDVADLLPVFNGLNKTNRTQPAHGQKVAFAPSKEAGDTSFPVAELVFRAQAIGGTLTDAIRQELSGLGQPPFYPLLEEARVQLSAVGEAAGDLLDDLIPVQIDQAFRDWGLPDMDLPDIEDLAEAATQHAGELFLGLVGDLKDMAFGSADKAGGLATPNFAIAALSRAIGPVGGVLDDLRKGTFDPKTFFDLGAKLLGSLKLGDVIQKLTEAQSLGQYGPKIQTIIQPKPPAIPEKVITRLDWKPKLEQFDPLKIFESKGEESGLTLKAEIVTDLKDAAASTFSVEGLLRNVNLNLIGADPFLIIEVKQVKFTAGKDKPPDVDPQLGEIHFAGPLAFVEEMRNFLSSLGKGFGVDVQPTGIEASLTLPLPSISVGVFTLQNISINIGAKLPFTDDAARFRFSFCTRENPCILTVAMFGGAAFFGIECGTDKSMMLELSFEFGAAVAFDIGVASGGAEIMAGIYIKIENDDALLSGFLRAAGELDILGLIRISCEIYLGFEYHTKSDKCVGIAKFYLEIEIFGFITIPVKAQVRRAFGGEGDPTFAQLMSEDDWTEYCEAYAPLGTP